MYRCNIPYTYLCTNKYQSRIKCDVFKIIEKIHSELRLAIIIDAYDKLKSLQADKRKWC